MDSTSFAKDPIGGVGLPTRTLALGAANTPNSTPLHSDSAGLDAFPAAGTGGKGGYSVLEWCSLLEAALHALPDAVTIRDASGHVIFENPAAMTPQARAPDSAFITTLHTQLPVHHSRSVADDGCAIGATQHVCPSAFINVRASVCATNPVVRRLLDSLPQMTCQMSGATQAATWLNKRWYEYSGMHPEGQKRQRDYIHPDDRGRGTAAIADAMETRRPFGFEMRVRGADGNYRWHTVQGEPVGNDGGRIALWVATATDSSAQKQLQQALETKTALLHTALDQLPVSVVVAAVPGFMQFANRAAMTGSHHIPM